MEYQDPVDLEALLNVAGAAAVEIVSPSARYNIAGVIAARAVEQYVAEVEQGKEIHNPNAWVATAARRRAIEAMRKWTIEKNRYHRIDVDDPVAQGYEASVSYEIIRYLEAESDEYGYVHTSLWVSELVGTAIPDPVNRQIAIRCLVDGEKPGAVAKDLGLKPPVVSNRLARIKKKLRDEISVDDLRH